MKKSYQTPTLRIVLLQHQALLLQSTTQGKFKGKFSDDAPSGGWDAGGACVKGNGRVIWDDDWSN